VTTNAAQVETHTSDLQSLVVRILATTTENYDAFLAETNLASVAEHNRTAGRRMIKLTRAVDRLTEKVDACQKAQESSWQTINELMGRLQTIRETVVRMTSGKTKK
jgi:hypothetical protein